jgi:DivIVA domain-containing protein
MESPVPKAQSPDVLTAIEIRALRFPSVKGFGRGYDPTAVDHVIGKCAATVESLTLRLVATRSELIRVRTELDELQSQLGAADQAVQLLKTAQATADAIVTKAMADQERAAEVARELAEQAREAVLAEQREGERKARQATEEAARRSAALQEQAGERLHRLTVATELAEQEIEREANQLQTFRNSTKNQIEEFIDGVLDHVAEQYGRAHPLAAQAAATASRRSLLAAQANGKPPVGGRGRRAPRVAGRPSVPVERWADAGSHVGTGITPSEATSTTSLPQQYARAENLHE